MGPSTRSVDVVSVGDIAVDLVVSLREYPNRGGDTEISQIQTQPGGSAANFAVAVTRLGLSSCLLGKIGSDEVGSWLRNGLEREGVDVSHIQQTTQRTSTVIVIVENSGRRTMLSFRGASRTLAPSEIPRGLLSNAQWLHISGYSLIHRPQRDAALRAMRDARTEKVRVSLDPSPHIHLAKSRVITSALKLTDVIIPNRQEARYLSRKSRIHEAARLLLRKGPSLVVMKLGRRGCLVTKHGEETSVPAFKVKAVDTTGAGDAFDGGFVVAQLRGMSVRDSAEFANAVAALKTTRMGARAGLPRSTEVEKFMKHEQT